MPDNSETPHLYVQLFGGASYFHGHDTHAWRAKSLNAARAAWIDRRDSNGVRTCHDYERGGRTLFPTWGDGFAPGDIVACAWYVHADDPRVTQRETLPWLFDTVDAFPDRILVIGNRGGLHWEPA